MFVKENPERKKSSKVSQNSDKIYENYYRCMGLILVK